ncbi:MAG: golvesin C-terminal-like domain-containing protein [Deferrisomatales bacterium]
MGGSDDWYRWTPTLPGGNYEVYLWWTAYWSRSPIVPVTIRHADGTATVIVDETKNGGQWNHLGTWRFSAGSSGWVELSGRGGQASADAVRFVRVP